MKLEIGDCVEIFVSNGLDMKSMHNFYAGTFIVNSISLGRPTKVTFLPRNTDNQDADTP
jgi:hypothetical protein